MKLAGRKLDGTGAPFVIAEIGNNHDGSVRQAEALIRAAADAGADAVKFQTHIAEAEMLPSTPTPPHFDEPRFSFTTRMELDLETHRRLKAYAEERSLVFFSSPFSLEAVELLERVGVPAYKIASGEVTNPPLLEAVAATGRPTFISSGMSGLGELDAAIAIFKAAGTPFVIMQCTSAYPCPVDRVDLRAMKTLAERYDCSVGLSDHTVGINVAVAAAALGAVAIEKHFTLSRLLYGPDHHASLEPDDLKRLVDAIGEVSLALGSAEKPRDPSLDPVRATFEKSIVTRVPVEAGTALELGMLTTKRPGNGIAAVRLSAVLGRRTARSVEANHLLEEADLA
jgi:N-acetylneuraminate synthase